MNSNDIIPEFIDFKLKIKDKPYEFVQPLTPDEKAELASVFIKIIGVLRMSRALLVKLITIITFVIPIPYRNEYLDSIIHIQFLNVQGKIECQVYKHTNKSLWDQTNEKPVHSFKKAPLRHRACLRSGKARPGGGSGRH